MFSRNSQQALRELTHTRIDRGEPDHAASLPTPARTGTSMVGACQPTLDLPFDQTLASRPRDDTAPGLPLTKSGDSLKGGAERPELDSGKTLAGIAYD